MAGQKVTCFCPGLAQTKLEGLKDPSRIFGFSSFNLPQDGHQKTLALEVCQEQGSSLGWTSFSQCIPPSHPPGPQSPADLLILLPPTHPSPASHRGGEPLPV